jgi:hypothetical protein
MVSLFALCNAGVSAQISTEASAHLDEIISVLQRAWLHRNGMDWASFRQRVFAQAGAAQTIPETYDAIRVALRLLGDRHSYYVTASGENLAQSPGQCIPLPAITPLLPKDVGYVRIQIRPATPKETIQQTLRSTDGGHVVGWIVDLRDSRGGNMWPALAGIGPLLGDTTAGFFIGADQSAIPWGYSNGEAWLNTRAQIQSRVEVPYQMAAAATRVAVLTDIGVTSSGEAIAIAFRGRPNTRSSGTPTCGLSTATEAFKLTSGGQIVVVTALMADRTMKHYGVPVVPDEVITDPSNVVPRALAWLHER